MYRDVFYDSRRKLVHLWTWDEEGNRVKIEEPFNPYIFIESSQDKDAVSIYETNLKKITFPKQFDRRQYVDQCGTSRIFYNLRVEQQYLIDKFGQLNQEQEFSKFPLKIFFLDIEVFSPDVFPKAEDAEAPINLITIYDNLTDTFHTFGLEKPYTPKQPNSKYYQCLTETDLLQKFIKFWQRDFPDILAGWNSETFDIPYLINRITRVLGEDWAKKLSPINSIYYRPDVVEKFGKKYGRWHIHGINCIDYMEAYLWGSRNEKESYSLNYISQVELGEGKLNYNATSLSKLAENNWDEFVDYNIQDVHLIKKLDDKLRFLKMIRMLGYMGLARFEQAMGKIAIVTGVVALGALKRNRIIPTFKNENQGKYAGGFVREIQPSLTEHVVTFDANSLYPNALISLNLSPETKLGKIISAANDKVEIRLVNGKIYNLSTENFTEFVKKEEVAISKAKVLYSQKKKGIIPELVDNIYSQRVKCVDIMTQHEKSLVHCKKGSENYILHKTEVDRQDVLQYTLKILLNSIYGVFANSNSPLYDIDNASSITLTGQSVAKCASDILNEFAKEKYGIEKPITHYNDTDSVHCSLTQILTKLNIKFLNKENNISKEVYVIANELQDYLNKRIIDWANKSLNSKDARFFFKREAICSAGIYQSKKHYILHVKDKGKDDPIPCDKIKYVGVEIAKSTVSEEVKNLIKRVVEAIMYTRNNEQTNKVYREVYEEFKKLSTENIAFRVNISKYDEYENKSEGFVPGKGTPAHYKAAIFYNELLKEHNIQTKYDNISSGMKMKWFYCAPNKYSISCIGFVDKFPPEITEIVPDYEEMFNKIVAPAINRLYESASWSCMNLKNEFACDIFDLLKE